MLRGGSFRATGRYGIDATALLDEYIAHRLDRERQVLASLQTGAKSIPELRRAIYADLDPRLEGAAEIQLAAHLAKLCDEGRAAESDGAYRLTGGSGGRH